MNFKKIYVIISINKENRGIKKGRIKMCKALDKIKGKTSEEILECFGDQNCVPIDLNQILTNIGISAIKKDFSVLNIDGFDSTSEENILGALVVKDDSAAIFYSSTESETRTRFTIAHELAHACLMTDQNIQKGIHIEWRTTINSPDQKEYDCNVFAGALLIPEKSLRKIKQNLIEPRLEILADIFNVSKNVMEERIKYLNQNCC